MSHCSTLTAQVTWQGDDGIQPSKWGVPGNWSGGAVPISTDDVIVGAPSPTEIDSVFGPLIASVSTLEVQVDGAIEIADGKKLDIHGGTLSNDGSVTVNSDAGANARLGFVNGGTISGSGDILLPAPGVASEILVTLGTLTHEAGHTIRGEGQINGAFINNGSIVAEDGSGDLNGALLIIGSGTKTNNGTIQSSTTSNVSFLTDITQGAGGKIVADTKKVFLNNRTFTGGTLESVNGGIFESIDGTLTLDSIHLLGTLHKYNSATGSTLNVANNTLTNDGTIQIGIDATESTVLNFATSETIDGSGEIILMTENLTGVGSRIRSSGGVVGTIGANQTVRGVGVIEAGLINDGTIIAEPQIGTILQFETSTNPQTNNNLIRADAGATLRIRVSTITQNAPNGRILANEGTVQLDAGGTIVGGRLEAVGAGTFTLTTSGRLTNVINNAPFTILDGNNTLNLNGTSLENNNTITNRNRILVESDVALSGSGEILLPDLANGSFITVNSGFTLTQDPGHTIRGRGQITGAGMTINNGRLEGNSAAEMLEIRATKLGGTGVLDDVRIGFVATHSPGESTAIVPLEGSYSLGHISAHLEIEIGGPTPGTQHDQLNSTGAVNLDGVLDVLALDVGGYTPTAGDRFDIIESTSDIVGTFFSANFPSILGGRSVTWLPVDYLTDPKKVTLEIATVDFLAGDFDENGMVDNADLTTWETGLGMSAGATHMDGDADGDFDVDAF
ncbi:MAG: hypothetical protein KDA99_30335, partial [Planctomycetales bacterium]|nr:hypothetical protein [Planctomycetales bacterium]